MRAVCSQPAYWSRNVLITLDIHDTRQQNGVQVNTESVYLRMFREVA